MKSLLQQKFLALLNKRQTRKIANNTYLRQESDGTLALKLHATDIIRVRPDGVAQIQTGGWMKKLTRDRISEYVRCTGLYLYQRANIWYWSTGKVFSDGDMITARGKLISTAPRDAEAKQKKLLRDINAFAGKCAAAVPLALPGPGDCLFCQAASQKPGEDFGGTEHLLSHLEEGYIVPSLVWNALVYAGYKPERNIQFAIAFKREGGEQTGGMADLGRDAVKRSVRKYLRAKLVK